MSRLFLQVASWLVGVAAVAGIAWYYGADVLLGTLRELGWAGLAAWLALSISARLLLAETAVLPLSVLGYQLGRSDAFWLGWIRSFANQVVPLSGVAAFAHLVRQRLPISWSDLAALAAPQFVLALAALGVVGVLATALNAVQLRSMALALGALYVAVFALAMSVSRGAAWVVESLPAALAARAAATADSLRKLSTHPGLVLRLVAFHGIAIVFRGGRMWILFAAIGVSLEWTQVLLLLAIAESSMLINVTPGALGIREGAILGGAALIGVPADIAAGVAVADRLLLVAMTVLLAPPAFVLLRAPRPSG